MKVWVLVEQDALNEDANVLAALSYEPTKEEQNLIASQRTKKTWEDEKKKRRWYNVYTEAFDVEERPDGS